MISICIPVYEMKGRGVEMLHDLLESIYMQSYSDYEIIVSDNSRDNVIADYCKPRAVRYFRNTQHDNPASNFNNAINQAKGDIIKPMCQDDKFTGTEDLAKIAECKTWLVCSSSDHIPYMYRDAKALIEGENTYGSPSAVAWCRNDLRFDERLLWLMDCDMWAQMTALYGLPELQPDVVIDIRHWEGQLTYTEGGSHRRVTDLEYIQAKYKNLYV